MALERFEERLTNPPGQGDPGLYVDLVGLKKAAMFDIGENTLSPGELTRVRALFISHTHIDHWIGFDRLLRVILGSEREVHIYGPPGMADFVRHRIHGYVWNLTFEDHVRFFVHELAGDTFHVVELSLEDRFQTVRDHGQSEPHQGVAHRGDGYRVEFAELDHTTPCLGWAFVEEDRYSFDLDRLTAAGMKPGPELAHLKARFLAGEDPLRAQTLGEFQPGRRVAYVTDTALTPKSVEAVCRLARNAEVLYCEATYPDEDLEKATAVGHLTGGQCGALARAASVKELVPFHFSRRYAQDPSQILSDIEEGRAGRREWIPGI